jgi:hypothetical protein
LRGDEGAKKDGLGKKKHQTDAGRDGHAIRGFTRIEW